MTRKSEIFEILKMAQEIESETPIATKNQFFSLLYPSSELNYSVMYKNLLENVVFSLPTSEIIENFKLENKSPKSIRYVIIDCRSLESFNFARLPTALHIGANVKYDEKSMIEMLKRFENSKGSHFSIFGTGRQIDDEINLLKLIAMKFIHNGFPHISIAMEGFKGCIKFITNNQIEYLKEVKKEEEFSITDSIQNLGLEIFGWGKKQVENFTKNEETQNTPSFSLDDDENTSIQIDDKEDVERIIKIDSINKIDSNIKVFKANENNQKIEKRFLILGENIILLIKTHPTKFGYGVIIWKRFLREVLKLSYKKEKKNIITFYLKGKQDSLNGNEEGEFVHILEIEDAQGCVEKLQQNIAKLKNKVVG